MVTIKLSIMIDFNHVFKKRFSLFFLIPQTAMVERPKLAAVRGHYAYFYAQLDGLRDRAHGPNCHHDPQKDTEVEETYNLAEIHSPPPGQR